MNIANKKKKMHAKIFQIGTNSISEEEYVEPKLFCESSYCFADYVGDIITGQAREESIKSMVHTLGVFDYDGTSLVYKGSDQFVKDWSNEIKNKAKSIDWSSSNYNLELHEMSRLLHETHKESTSRFFIEEWNGWAGPASDIIDFVRKHLQIGDKLYIGAVIDYHY